MSLSGSHPRELQLNLAELKNQRPFNVKGDIVFVVGGPGAGKRTHCERLAEAKGYVHISTSDLVKNILIGAPPSADEAPEVKAIREDVRKKELLDDQMIIDLLKCELANHPRATGFLIDGCPRTLTQLFLFESQIKPCSKVLFFNTPEEKMRERVLSRNNPDDTAASFAKSMDVYKRVTVPVIRHLFQTKGSIFHQIDASGQLEDVSKIVDEVMKTNPIKQVGYLEFLRLYFSCGNFYDAVEELQKRYGGASDFQVMLSYVTMFYVIQNREDVKRLLTGNTVTGYQNHNFEVAAGHELNINGVQAWQNKSGDEKNPIWENIHKELAKSTGDKNLLTSLVRKHIHTFLAKKTFALDIAFEEFMLDFWCEYMFGDKVKPQEYRDMRKTMLEALSYSYYGNKLKSIPYVGNLTCRIYGYWKSNEFREVDNELKRFIDQACADKNGLIYRFKQALLESKTFPAELVEKAVLDNAFDFVLVFDFIHNAMYETLAEILRRNIDSTEQRKRVFAQGTVNAFLFPFRARVPQSDLELQSGAIVRAGVPAYINLVKSGLYNSFGPRACIGTAVTDWVKDEIWRCLENVQFRIVKETYPEDREKLSHNRDVPVSSQRYEVEQSLMLKTALKASSERYEVERKFSRDYLQKVLPHYPFKGVEEFYDVLKAYEDQELTNFIVDDFVQAIKKQKLDVKNLRIVTVEMRGIAIASMVAHELGVPLVHIRKPGKIPGPVLREEYGNAYSEKETLEISALSDLKNHDVVLIDDGIASGGTALAALRLINRAGGNVKLVEAMIDHKYKEKPAELSNYNIHTAFDFQANSLKLNEQQKLLPALSLFQPAPKPVFAGQKVIFVTGGPGSGKGTHCQILVKKAGYHHISTGDLVRAMSKADANDSADDVAFKKTLAEKISRGEFMGDEFIIEIVRKEMQKHPEAKGFLIDGCPRTREQADLFAKAIKPCDLALFFDTTPEIMTQRMLERGKIEHRSDDNPETIARRLQIYKDKTMPVIEHLRDTRSDVFRRIDASGGREEIARQVADAIVDQPAVQAKM